MGITEQPSGLTPSTEDYLKAIYRLGLGGNPVQTSAIAEALDIAPPSVSGMLKRLSESGFVEYMPYRGATLTRVGHKTAARVVRRHRVIETYLATKLGYEWDSVHAEAERLEHAASDELIERMVMTLGNPQYHPHGAPIPTKDGLIETQSCVPLTDIAVGEVVELRMVSDKNPERLRYLSSLQLKPGISFEVLSRQPFQGPINIRFVGSNRQEHVIGYELARSLFCDVLGNEAG